MALFLSTTTNKVDRKGRVSVPAPFRNALVNSPFQGIVAIPSFKYAALQCSGIEWLEQLSNGIGAYDFFSDEHDALTAALFANAQQIAIDNDGRIVLPGELAAHAGITEQAAFVGRGPTFEIWEPAAFRAYQATATQRAAEQALTVRPSTNPDGGAS